VVVADERSHEQVGVDPPRLRRALAGRVEAVGEPEGLLPAHAIDAAGSVRLVRAAAAAGDEHNHEGDNRKPLHIHALRLVALVPMCYLDERRAQTSDAPDPVPTVAAGVSSCT